MEYDQEGEVNDRIAFVASLRYFRDGENGREEWYGCDKGGHTVVAIELGCVDARTPDRTTEFVVCAGSKITFSFAHRRAREADHRERTKDVVYTREIKGNIPERISASIDWLIDMGWEPTEDTLRRFIQKAIEMGDDFDGTESWFSDGSISGEDQGHGYLSRCRNQRRESKELLSTWFGGRGRRTSQQMEEGP